MAKARAKASLTKRSPKVAGDELPPVGGDSCCDDVCKNVGAGKLMLVVCDGTTMKPLVGTQDGQYPAWDQTNQTWVLATV